MDFKEIIEEIRKHLPFNLYPDSLEKVNNRIYFLADIDEQKKLVSIGTSHDDDFSGDIRTVELDNIKYDVKICPLSQENALQLRRTFPYTKPSLIGNGPVFACGDRIGGIARATPAHIMAASKFDVFVILAQQSVRENERTGRSFADVLDDASWSVFQTGFKRPWGADANHIKELKHTKEAVKAGYSFFTIDPSDKISKKIGTAGLKGLRKTFGLLFNTPSEAQRFAKKYINKTFKLPSDFSYELNFSEEEFFKIAIRYLPAVRFLVSAYRYIKKLMGKKEFQFEISTDEAPVPTSYLAHYFISNSLREEGVRLYSVAVRFVGEFQKAADYIGDLKEFKECLRLHSAIAKLLGPYKIGIHAGSDKFRIYPLVAEASGGEYHVKTAGTSYLEALKVIAKYDVQLYQKIHQLALETFEENRKTYHVAPNLNNVPSADKLSFRDIERGLTTNNDWRQVMVVSYGPTFQKFGNKFKEVLRRNEKEYYRTIATHIEKHMRGLKLKRL